ncbi:MAG: glutaredoxin-like protein NrdH [Lactobacillales bacterium]|jgi:glutaredoxin-like protein NrdH|nr:glutaredoxin-like protein NrdH [Lactobacillales bacterium]
MKDIKVFSRNNCMQCKMVKRFLDEHHVAYQELNIDEQPEYIDYLREKGFQAVPVVESIAATFAGFRPDQLKAFVA